MSFKDYKRAMKLAKKCDEYEHGEGLSSEDIKTCEKLLGITFSEQCNHYYSKYGWILMFGMEFFTIIPDENSEFLEGNSVGYALNDRKEFGLPEKWIPFLTLDDGELACFDYSQLNSEGEPAIISIIYDGSEYIKTDLAEDFGGFLLEIIEEFS